MEGDPMPEDDGGYEAYVKYLYDRDVAPAVSRHRPNRHPMKRYDEYEYPLDRLARADATVRLINATSDPYDTFRPGAMARVIRDTSMGVRANSEMLSDLGFAETLHSEFPTLAVGMRPEHLPPQEAELLRRYGFPEVADNLPGILYVVREHAVAAVGRYQEVPPTTELRNVEQRLDQAVIDHDRICEIEEELVVLRRAEESNSNAVERLTEEAESKKKPRRWWKGLGQIIAGAGISLGDAAVAVGLGTAGVAPAWGALISVTVGVGTAMVGIGELRGE
jgi:hypothetical protein